ncbi:MAG: hypothetical protein B5M53_06150 [Candidatus Cloacimonas sp. 4484_209]|nr:MAG: hypothetical protein B5M53_06150 [Candidatus Cloacimonas sp. 4484_209]
MHQPLTVFRSDTRVISPFAQRLFRLFGCFSSAYVLLIFAIDGSLHFLWGVLLVGIGLISLFIYTGSKRRYYSPLIFTIFYFLGYLLAFTNILVNKNEIPAIGYGAIGSFGFTDEEFFQVVVVIYIGMTGIMVATFLAERVFNRRYVINEGRLNLPFLHSKTFSLRNWVLLWFIFSVSLILFMWHLGIGMVGLKPKITLPFKLVGTLVFLKTTFVPSIGIFLLGLALYTNRKRLTDLVFGMLVFVGILGSLASISRGYIATTASPALLFMVLTTYKGDWKKKRVLFYMVILLITTVISIQAVAILRNIGFRTGDVSIYEPYVISGKQGKLDVVEAFSSFIPFVLERVPGIRSLLAVLSSSVSELYASWAVFIGDSYVENILLSVYGFLPLVGDIHAFGTGFGLFGMFALSGSYIMIFLGAMISCLIVIFIENLFIKKGIYPVACFFSLYLSMKIWHGLYLFFLIRDGVIILLCYVLIMRVLKLSANYNRYNKESKGMRPILLR